MIIGVIGLGSIGMRHAQNLLAMGHDVHGWDPCQDRCAMLVSAGGTISPEAAPYNFRDIINCDAVVIASPSHQHLSHMRHSLSRKKPAFVEKPLAGGEGLSDASYAEKVIAEARSLVMMGNNMRYHQVIKVVRERMRELGEWESAWFHLAQRNTKYTDPVILNWGAHEVDLALYLLDRNLTVDKEITEVRHDDACVRLESANGRQIDIHLDYLTEPWERHFTIHCRNGSIHGDLENYTVHIFSQDGREIIAVEGSHDQTYVDEMKEFIRRVEGKPSDGIGATGEEGLVCLKLLLEAQK